MEDNTRETADHPVLRILTGHWLSVLGASLVTIAGCSWLLLLMLRHDGATADPYRGILIFFAVPVPFFAGSRADSGGRLACAAPHRGWLVPRARPPRRLPARGHLLRCDDRRQRCDRQPGHLPRCHQHGIPAILRTKLPHHETAVRSQPARGAPQRALRRMPCGSGRRWFRRSQNERNAPVDRSDARHLSQTCASRRSRRIAWSPPPKPANAATLAR